VSSTQEEATEEIKLPPLNLEREDEQQQNEQVLTQLEDENFVIDDSNYSYAPQHDNPSALMPSDEDDYALKEYMASQEQISQHFDREARDEFQLNLDDDSSVEEENNNAPSYTQRTLDAASMLLGGFASASPVDKHHGLPLLDTEHDPVDGDDNDGAAGNYPGLTSGRPNDPDDDLDADDEFMRKCHQYNQKHKIVTRTIDPDDDAALADQIANSLRKDGITGLSEAERAEVANCKRGKNKSKYMNTQASLKKRFFDTLATYGGHLAVLAQEEKPNPYDLSEESPLDKRWFAVVGGPKNASKKKIINDSFVCVFKKWTCKSGPKIGQQYEPSTFDKYMEQLTLVFQDAGVQHSYSQDFNKGGEFHGVVLEKWEQIRKQDLTFGTGKNRARVDSDIFTMFVSAIRNGDIRPYEDPEHLVLWLLLWTPGI